MLGKLIKYDFKANIKIYFGMYIFLLATALLAALSDWGASKYQGALPWVILDPITKVMYVIGIVAVLAVTFFDAVLRYRKNLLKDEGYLMHTLPVTAASLYFSKLITAILKMIVGCVVIYLTSTIVVRDFFWIVDFCKGFKTGFAESLGVLGVSATPLVILLGVVMILSVVASWVQFYLCLTLGYTWNYGNGNTNRDIMSVVSYFIIYAVLQVVSLAAMFIVVAIVGVDNIAHFETVESMLNYMYWTFGMSLGITVVSTVVCMVLSIKRLEKKLNLE